jgi:hypothetical protein
MRQIEFETWLCHSYMCDSGSAMAEAAITTRIANCKRVERFEGDLDQHASADGMAGLISRLNYSMEDQRQGVTLRHRIPIDGDLRTASATLKSAVKLYKQFCEAGPSGSPRLSSRPISPPAERQEEVLSRKHFLMPGRHGVSTYNATASALIVGGDRSTENDSSDQPAHCRLAVPEGYSK